jgi:hypothetical protein
MNLPGFSAEASLQRMVLAYGMAWKLDRLGNVVWPQQLNCDQNCLDTCLLPCPDAGDCPDGPPDLRAQCLAAARACSNACRKQCCTTCSVTCGPCTGGSCGSYPNCSPTPGTQSCTDCNGVTSTRSC